MENIPRPILSKIPGMPVAKSESHAKDLTKLTRAELLEIKEREEKLLANKSSINRLPDKGKRIKDFHEKVVGELERRSNVEEAAAMFSELNIAARGKDALNRLEWNGRLKGNELEEAPDPTEDVLDSDDEVEMDPLRVIAQRTMHERRTNILPPEPQLITEEDLAEIESFKAESTDSGISGDNTSVSISKDTNSNQPVVDVEIVTIDVGEKLSQLRPKLRDIIEKMPSKMNTNSSDSHSSTPGQQDVEQHVRYLVEKTEINTHPQRRRFKPYKTTVTGVHDPEKERDRKKTAHWEITAATPPPLQHSGTKLLTLLDSVEIQADYLAKLKELQEKQAAERLAAKIQRMENRKMQMPSGEDFKTKTAFTSYRTPTLNIEGDQHFNEDDEMHDPLDEEKPGGINYTVYE